MQTSAGRFGKGFEFDGNGDYVDMGDKDILSFGNGTNDNPISINAWIKPNLDGTVNNILAKWDTQFEWLFRVDAVGRLEFLIRDYSQAVSASARYSTTLSTNWTYVVATYDGRGGNTAANGIVLYINGIAVSATATNNANYVAMENGIDIVELGNSFNGTIDDVMIFNRSLSASEIQALYNSSAHCYDDETEIMTDEGWKKFEELDKDEEVLTLNPETATIEYHKPTEYQTYVYDGEMYRIETEEGELLVSPEHKVYIGEDDYLTKNISTNLGVEYTLTSSCFLKSSSLDQIAEPRYKANAKYGTSLACGANLSALDCISAGNLTIGNISILSLRILNASITSDLETPQISAIVPIFLVNSSIKYDVATNLNLSSKNKSCVLPLPIIAANKAVASTTSSIYLASLNLLATDSEILSVNSLAALSETLTLDENCLSFFNFSALSNIAFLATSDQSSLNSCMLFSNSSGTFNDMVAILSSPNKDNKEGYLNLSNFKLKRISDIYNNLDENKQLIFLDEKGNEIKVNKITKEKYSGRIYDVTVPNHIILVRRDGLAVWSGNSLQRDLSGLSDGNSYSYTAQVVDEGGNRNSSTLTFSVDQSTPQLSYVEPSPRQGGAINSTSATLNVSVSDATSTTTYAFFDDGLVGWWSMDDVNGSGDPLDLSGLGNDGDAQGNAQQVEAGRFGKGFEFDGDGDYVDCGSDRSINFNYTEDYSLSLWFKTGDSGFQGLLSNYDGDEPFSYVLILDSGNSLRVNMLDENGNLVMLDTSTVVNDNNWHHVAVIKNSTNMTIYLDGNFVRMSSTANLNSSTVSARNTYIGSRLITNLPFNGTIDEVMIFNRSLSATEIQALYNSSQYYLSRQLTGLSDGNSYSYTAHVVDEGGNRNQSTLTFDVDLTFPNINFTSPTPANASTQANNDIFVNVSASDTNNISTFIDFDNSLVGWWRMDDVNQTGLGAKVYDISGRGNNGTAKGNASQVQAGKFGKGFEFDGGGDYVDVSYNQNFNFTSSNKLTVSGWVNPLDLSLGNWIATQYTTSENKRMWALYFWNNGVLFVVYHNGSSTNFTQSISGAVISTSNWYYLTGVWNETNTLLYVNGVLFDSDVATNGNTIYDANVDFTIGATDQASSSFNGTIDDVMIFNRSLTAEEIKGLYANQSTRYLGVNFTSLSEGAHTFKAYTQDIAGNVNSTELRGVMVDTAAPSVSIAYPVNGLNISSNSIDLNASAFDNLAASLTYYWVINGTTNATSVDANASMNASNGYYNLTLSVSDGVNNGSDTVYFTLDTTAPTINSAAVSPSAGAAGTVFNIAVNVTDNFNIDRVIAYVQKPDENDTAAITLGLNNGLYNGSWDSSGKAEGTYVIDILANDSAGNERESENIGVIALSSNAVNVSVNSSVVIVANESVVVNMTEETDTWLNITAEVNLTASITVTKYSQNIEAVYPTGVTELGKYIDIVVDNNTNNNLSYAIIRVYYTDAEVSAANLQESTLRLYKFNLE